MFKTIPVWEVDQYIDRYSDLMLIDLRNQEAYRKGHIRGAVNLPFEEMGRWRNSLPANKLLLFYCARGGQSMSVCRDLERYGYHVVNIANGIAYYNGKYMVADR